MVIEPKDRCVFKKKREPLIFDVYTHMRSYQHFFFLTRYYHQGSWTSSTKLASIKYRILLAKVLEGTETICASVAILIQKNLKKVVFTKVTFKFGDSIKTPVFIFQTPVLIFFFSYFWRFVLLSPFFLPTANISPCLK